MSVATLRAIHPEAWYLLGRLGEMQLMLPIGLTLVAWLAWIGERRRAAWWLAMLGLAVGITAASKIAFIGWGIGSARLDFTGFSGHAMHSAAVMPLLAAAVTAGLARWVQASAWLFALALAALVALSRVAIGAHTPSEAVLGFALGALASGAALALGHPPQSHLPRWLLAAVVAALLLNSSALPTLPTHDAVTRLALALSGRERPYTRQMMLREERLRQRKAQQPVAAAPGDAARDRLRVALPAAAAPCPAPARAA